MPRDSVRNIPNYQNERGHLNEFEFQRSQGEMTVEPELPFEGESFLPDQPQPKSVEEMSAEAHRKVEKRKKKGHHSAKGETGTRGSTTSRG